MLPELDQITITLKDAEDAWGRPYKITGLNRKQCHRCLLCRGMICNGANVFALFYTERESKQENFDYVHRKCLTVEHVKLKLAQ